MKPRPGVLLGAFDALNARHPWSHNDQFHGWMMRALPAQRRTALDVGCGRGGLLEQLAARVERVTGIDPDEEMARAARARFAGRPDVEVRQQSLLDTTGRFDVVTAVASLHHLPFEAALRHAGGLVAPGGRLLVVGLAEADSPTDAAVDAVSSLLNPMVGLAKHPRPVRGGRRPPDVPVRDAEESYDQVREIARRVLPGAQVRHRLWFRYTIVWKA